MIGQHTPSKYLRLVPVTWHHVPQSDGRHGDEAEVESLEEGPVFPGGKEGPSNGCVQQ